MANDKADKRSHPYPNYNFEVEINTEPPIDSAFSDVSGLATELTVAEYRNGNDKGMYVRKIPGLHKTTDVTLKRGVVDSTRLWKWITDARMSGVEAHVDVTVTMLGPRGEDEVVHAWMLRNCIPLKYTGPTLAAKGGGDVAIEELTLSCEDIVATTTKAE